MVEQRRAKQRRVEQRRRSAGAVRPLTRDVIIEAAREQTVARGWNDVRMGDVAAAAGVSRQTVYNEFGSRVGLAEALARQEIERFVVGVRVALTDAGDDLPGGLGAAITYALTEAADNPLIKAIITGAEGGSDELLLYLTTRSGLVLEAAKGAVLGWVQQRLPVPDPGRLAIAVDSIARLAVSHIVLPLAPVERTAAELTRLAVLLVSDACATRSGGGPPEHPPLAASRGDGGSAAPGG